MIQSLAHLRVDTQKSSVAVAGLEGVKERSGEKGLGVIGRGQMGWISGYGLGEERAVCFSFSEGNYRSRETAGGQEAGIDDLEAGNGEVAHRTLKTMETFQSRNLPCDLASGQEFQKLYRRFPLRAR